MCSSSMYSRKKYL
uniref:Uncharacterized protein n=1 Tax=Arundo donax TaxID=35708 RepID=A0A0A8Z8I1_ARUDO